MISEGGTQRVKAGAWKQAEAAGLDMSLIELNLSKSPLERIRSHQRALTLAVELRNAMRRREQVSDA